MNLVLGLKDQDLAKKDEHIQYLYTLLGQRENIKDNRFVTFDASMNST